MKCIHTYVATTVIKSHGIMYTQGRTFEMMFILSAVRGKKEVPLPELPNSQETYPCKDMPSPSTAAANCEAVTCG